MGKGWYEKITQTWQNYISRKYDKQIMYNVLHDLLENENIEPKFISYAIKYGGTEGWLHYPQGLYFAIKDKKVIRGWNELISNRVRRKAYIESNQNIQTSRTYRQPIKPKETVKQKKVKNFEALFQ